ncbi:MAG: GNAT family N-acetyltransferase [Thermotogae bacterium]|nr:GNAT family N-acetyltransferase [Thermotogota bacterium]
MRVKIQEESNVHGALVIEDISEKVFPQYSRWDYISVMNYVRIGGRIFVAYTGKTVLGGAFLRRLTDRIWELTMIGVYEEFRGKGVGKKLMETILKEVKGDIHLHVECKNRIAIALYEFFGFRRIRRIPHFYSTGEDAYLMILKRTPKRPKNSRDGLG